MQQNTTPLISIIVPIYNGAAFLLPCLDSIAAQTHLHFEALLIDDGSTDESGRLCDEYAARDPRFCVHHKENGGVSSARNLGIQLAQGEYTAFVDCDDLIAADYLEILLRNMVENRADLVCCNFTIIDEVDAPIAGHPRSAGGSVPNVKTDRVVDDPDTLIADVHQYSEYYHTHVTAALIRTASIKTRTFSHQLRHYEDGDFLFHYFVKTRPTVVLTAYAGYSYRINLSSVTHSVSAFALRPRQDYLALCRRQFTALQEIGHPYAQAFLAQYAEAIHALAYAAAQKENAAQRKPCRSLLAKHIRQILPYRAQLSKGSYGRIALYRACPWLHGLLSRFNEQVKG